MSSNVDFKSDLLWLSDDLIIEELPHPDDVDDWMSCISSMNIKDNSPESMARRIQEANDCLDEIVAGFKMIGSKVSENGSLSWIIAPVTYQVKKPLKKV